MLTVSDVCLNNAESSRENTGFSHSFVPGEISVVLGANQSGKTDLCRLIAGLNTRASGDVTLNGESLGHRGPRDRPVSMVYQAFVNYPNLTVFENIASPLRADKTNGSALAGTVRALAEKLRIETLLERLPSELSGGQQQRVAIARALAQDAKVLLLDEPLVNLDFKLREALEVELRELLKATSTVVVYTSSDPRDAFNLGDHLLLLAEGQKIQSGAPLDVYKNPGCINAMALLADPDINRFYRDDALYAVRPEHLKVTTVDALPPEYVGFDMQVTAYETNGDESFVHGKVDGMNWVLRDRGMLHVDIGRTILIAAAPQDIATF